MKTLLKSVDIYQSYCKKNLAQFFLAHPVDINSWSVAFPIFDISIPPGDICDKSLKLSEIAPISAARNGSSRLSYVSLWFLSFPYFQREISELPRPIGDRPETLPRDRQCVQFYNPGRKIPGAFPPKNWGPKTCKIRVDFRQLQTSIAKISGTAEISKIGRTSDRQRFLPRSAKKSCKLFHMRCREAAWQFGYNVFGRGAPKIWDGKNRSK